MGEKIQVQTTPTTPERRDLAQGERHDTGDNEHSEPSEYTDHTDHADQKFSPERLRRRLIWSDIASLVVGMAAATLIQQLVRPVTNDVLEIELVIAAVILPIWIVVLAMNKVFLARTTASVTEEARRLITASIESLGLLVALAFVAQQTKLSRLWVALLFVCVTTALLISRSVARWIFGRLRREGRIGRPVLIVGTGTDAISLLHATQRRVELGYRVVGFIGDDYGERGGLRVLGPVDETLAAARQVGASGVILSLASIDPDVVNRLTRQLTDAGIHVTLSTSLRDIDISRARSQDIDGRLMIYVEPTNRSRSRLFLKRTFDIVVASVVLALTLPITVIAAIAIKVESRGPILFSQLRVGKDSVTFRMYKLRSMVPDAEARLDELKEQNERSGPLFKMRSDPRVTRVGRIIRKTSIDELPQMWNVLKGDMSVVGPRPALQSESDTWSTELRERVRVLPGITGMWQVSARDESDFEVYQRLDLFYVDNWSLAHDLKIVLKTFAVVLVGRGSH